MKWKGGRFIHVHWQRDRIWKLTVCVSEGIYLFNLFITILAPADSSLPIPGAHSRNSEVTRECLHTVTPPAEPHILPLRIILNIYPLKELGKSPIYSVTFSGVSNPQVTNPSHRHQLPPAQSRPSKTAPTPVLDSGLLQKVLHRPGFIYRVCNARVGLQTAQTRTEEGGRRQRVTGAGNSWTRPLQSKPSSTCWAEVAREGGGGGGRGLPRQRRQRAGGGPSCTATSPLSSPAQGRSSINSSPPRPAPTLLHDLPGLPTAPFLGAHP